VILHFTIGNPRRKARDSNASRPGRAHSFVRIEARPAVSGDLPFVACQWTRRESNPGLRHARAVSYRWTMGPQPFNQWTAGESNPDFLRARQASFRWTSSPVPGRPHEFLLLPPGEGRDEGPVAGDAEVALTLTLSRGERGPDHLLWEGRTRERLEGLPESRTRSPSLPRRRAAGTPADRRERIVPEGVEPPLPPRKGGAVASGPARPSVGLRVWESNHSEPSL
jgi:hypothetical protein